MVNYFSESTQNWMAQVKEKWHSLDSSHGWFFHFFLYGMIGFIIGFLFKYIGRPFIGILLGTLLILLLLQSLQFITIHDSIFYSALGIPPGQDLIGVFISWVNAHKAESLSIGLGFFAAWIFA